MALYIRAPFERNECVREHYENPTEQHFSILGTSVSSHETSDSTQCIVYWDRRIQAYKPTTSAVTKDKALGSSTGDWNVCSCSVSSGGDFRTCGRCCVISKLSSQAQTWDRRVDSQYWQVTIGLTATGVLWTLMSPYIFGSSQHVQDLRYLAYCEARAGIVRAAVASVSCRARWSFKRANSIRDTMVSDGRGLKLCVSFRWT